MTFIHVNDAQRRLNFAAVTIEILTALYVTDDTDAVWQLILRLPLVQFQLRGGNHSRNCSTAVFDRARRSDALRFAMRARLGAVEMKKRAYKIESSGAANLFQLKC
jgi:hypothetical protein